MTIRIIALVILLSGCHIGQTKEERAAGWEDWELCGRFAGFVYSGNSPWIWYATDLIKARGLAENAKCQAVYDAKMRQFYASQNSNAVHITFGEAVKGAPTLDNVVR